jgi:hypothetical protein
VPHTAGPRDTAKGIYYSTYYHPMFNMFRIPSGTNCAL